MGRDISPVIFKNLKAFLGVFFKEVNFWPLILDISWVSGGMIALFWRKMLFFGSFVLFLVGKYFWCIWDAFQKSLENFRCILDAFWTHFGNFGHVIWMLQCDLFRVLWHSTVSLVTTLLCIRKWCPTNVSAIFLKFAPLKISCVVNFYVYIYP